MLRSKFEDDLNKLHVDLDRMCHLVVNAIENCVHAFETQDNDLARDIVAGDKIINDMERAIESRCLNLILRQQPVASDLRDVSTALKVVTDLERIGDQCADIADLLLEIDVKNSYGIVAHIPVMADFCKDMVTLSLDAFHQHDTKKAREVHDMDQKLDELFEQVKEELIAIVKESSNNIDMAISFLMIAKYFEKIGDHAKNICEWIQFNQTGKMKDQRIL